MASGCLNWKGEPVADGERYFPKKAEPCLQCVCNDGIPTPCHNVHCKAPTCDLGELAQQVKGECCEYYCIELPDHNQDEFDTANNTTGIILDPNVHSTDNFNRSMRLVASTVTTVLILGLLLYMFHRLKKRRVLVMMRRMRTEQEDDNVAYVSNFNSADVGMSFGPFGDLPPPYSPPKAPDIDEGEPPPPYEAAVGQTTDPNLEPSRNGYIPLNGVHTGSQQQQQEGNQCSSPSHMTNAGHTQGSENCIITQLEAADDPDCYHHDNRTQETNRQSLLHQDGTVPRTMDDQSPPAAEHGNTVPYGGGSGIGQNSKVKSLMVSLDRNGKVKSHCQRTTTSRLACNNPTENSACGAMKGACKKRHKCPHAKKARAAVRSCSFKDEYSQTLAPPPPRGCSADMDQFVGDTRMCNSYHASTNTGVGLEADSDAEDDVEGVMSGMAWHRMNKDIGDDEQKEQKCQPSMQIDNVEAGQNIATDATNLVDIVKIKGSSGVALDNEGSLAGSVGATECNSSEAGSQPKIDLSDGSQSSVCSETGEKRITVGASDISTDQRQLLNLSSGSGDFNSLREAMKGEQVHQDQGPVTSGDGSSSIAEEDLLNSQDIDQSKRRSNGSCTLFDASDQDRCIDNNGLALLKSNPLTTNASAMTATACHSVNKKDISSDMSDGPQNEDQSKTRCLNNKISGILPNVSLKNCKQNGPATNPPSKVCKRGPGKADTKTAFAGEEAVTTNALMTRSACTAAECGIDTASNEEQHTSSSLDGSLSSRLKREHVKKKESPETYRRLSMAYSEGNAFKQYGFIDLPYSKENMENVLRDERSKAASKKMNEAKNEVSDTKKIKKRTSQEMKEMVSLGCITQDKKPTKKAEYIGPTESSTAKVKRMSRLSRNCEQQTGEHIC